LDISEAVKRTSNHRLVLEVGTERHGFVEHGFGGRKVTRPAGDFSAVDERPDRRASVSRAPRRSKAIVKERSGLRKISPLIRHETHQNDGSRSELVAKFATSFQAFIEKRPRKIIMAFFPGDHGEAVQRNRDFTGVAVSPSQAKCLRGVPAGGLVFTQLFSQ